MPSQPPSNVIKYALILETIGTIAWSGYIFFKPSALLDFFGIPLDIPQVAYGLCQIIAAITAGFTLICWLAVAEGPAAVPIRRFTYIIIGGNEICLCAGLLYMMLSGQGDVGGIPNKGLWAMIIQLGPVAVWRVFALTMKPHWFGANTVHGKTA